MENKNAVEVGMSVPDPARIRVLPAVHACAWCIVVTLAALALTPGTPTLAQDTARIKAGLDIWKSSGCPDCHGSFADGEKQRDDAPAGANLRTARLNAAEIKTTISCGRPGGAGMPAFDEGAYTVRPCYGRPLGPAPDDLYPTPRPLTPDQIDAVATYLQARVIGRGRITRDECLFYFDGDEDACEDYK
jgi:mono/diheme cytochrome c family protein